MTLKQAFIDTLNNQQPGASIPGIIRELVSNGHADAAGDFTLELSGNIWLWHGASKEFLETFIELRRARQFHLHPVLSSLGKMAFMSADGWMDLPLAVRPPADGYKEPHWIPVLLHPGAKCSSSECPER